MTWFKNLKRILKIYRITLKHGLNKTIFFPQRWVFGEEEVNGQAIREAIEELGPIFVKAGQLLSTRRDLLPDNLADELAKLQDNVPAFSSQQAIAIIEKNLKKPIHEIFDDFENAPLASASISQVHGAKLKDGSQVVVKVLRPNIHRDVARDLNLLEMLAHYLDKFSPKLRRFRPIEVIQEIKQTLTEELDLLREAANASQLRRNFADSQSLYVPKIYWQYCTSEIMIIERVHAVRISNVAELKARNTNLKVLAERGVEIFFTQVFRDSFFHADMHPGNIFVKVDDPERPQYIAVDFGIMGTLGPIDKRYLGENFLAFFKRDYRRVAELHVESGWVAPSTPVSHFESAIRTVCEPIFEKPLKEISFGNTLLRLFQVAKQFDMQVQPQLILLQKTLLSIEGLGRQLYPDLDLWATAKPFLEKWMKRYYGPRQMFKNFKDKLPYWSEKLPDLPEAIYDVARFHQQQVHEFSYQLTQRKTKTGFLKLTLKQWFGLLLLVGFTVHPLFTSELAYYFAQIIGLGAGFYLLFAKSDLG